MYMLMPINARKRSFFSSNFNIATKLSFALKATILVVATSLTACGGGGSDDAPSNPALTPDTTAPVITLNGDSTLTVSAGSAFTDLGAKATDDTDGEVTVAVTGEVTVDVVNSYTIT